MIHLKLETSFTQDGEVQAVVMHDGAEIDRHYHSSESFLLNDWCFKGGLDSFNHRKEITEKVGEEWELSYTSQGGKLYKLTNEEI